MKNQYVIFGQSKLRQYWFWNTNTMRLKFIHDHLMVNTHSNRYQCSCDTIRNDPLVSVWVARCECMSVCACMSVFVCVCMCVYLHVCVQHSVCCSDILGLFVSECSFLYFRFCVLECLSGCMCFRLQKLFNKSLAPLRRLQFQLWVDLFI